MVFMRESEINPKMYFLDQVKIQQKKMPAGTMCVGCGGMRLCVCVL